MKELSNKSSSPTFFYRWGSWDPKMGSISLKDYRASKLNWVRILISWPLVWYFSSVRYCVSFYFCRNEKIAGHLQWMLRLHHLPEFSFLAASTQDLSSVLCFYLHIWRAPALRTSGITRVQMIPKSALPIVIFHWCSSPVLPYFHRISPIGMNVPQ